MHYRRSRAAGSSIATLGEEGTSRPGCLEREIDWFADVVGLRLGLFFGEETADQDIVALSPPEPDPSSAYGRLVLSHDFGFEERLVLILALLPHLRPQVLDCFLIRKDGLDRGFCEFGGWAGEYHGGFLPTCETAVFLLAGNDLDKRLRVQDLFAPEHTFTRERVLRIEPAAPDEPPLSSRLCVTSEVLCLLTRGRDHGPDYSLHFPAERITSPLEWADLVLPPEAMAELEKIHTWLHHGETLMEEWGLARILQPGYRALFHGPPGTGKTLAACLIGKAAGVDVYRVDLAAVVSKYIGETARNLASLFDQAQSKRWILFFDEADTLFGKRTAANTVHDRHANQETAYLLQRIETYPGIAVLATNLEDNIDKAFFRRFQSRVAFPVPDADARLRLWQGFLKDDRIPRETLDLARLAADYPLAGGAITNAVRHAALRALGDNRAQIRQQDLIDGLERELAKEGRGATRSRLPPMG